MLLIAGGLLYWKLGGTSAESEAAPPARSEAKPKRVFDAPPPPPPPAAAATEEPPPGDPKQSKTTAASGPSGCSDPCVGEASATLRSALSGKAGLARGCYERALRQNPMLQGRVTVQVRVSPAGRACSVGMVENSLNDPAVTGCITRNFSNNLYPPPQGGCVDVKVPMNFMAKQ